MPERILFPEFRDELELTRYPFGDTATLLSDDGIVLDVDMFLDASLYPIGAQGWLYLASVDIGAQSIILTVNDETKHAVAVASFTGTDPPAILYFTDARGRPAGIVVSEPLRLARLSAWPIGVHTFPVTATKFVTSCIIPTPETGVRGVLTGNNELLTDDLWLVGDNGVVLRSADEHTIRVDIVGDPLFVRKCCGQVGRFNPPLFVQTINGCPPDAYGNYHLVVGDYLAPETIVRIYPTETGTLRIEAVDQVVTEGQ